MITAPPDGAIEMVCPSMVAADPGVMVFDPITRFEFASWVKVEEPTTKPGLEALAVAPGRVITWPLTVIAPPADRIWVPIKNAELEFAVILEPSTTTTAGTVEAGGASVAPLTIIAFPSDAIEICCPSTVIDDPGARVCDPTIMAEPDPFCIVWVPTSKGAGAGVVLSADTTWVLVGEATFTTIAF